MRNEIERAVRVRKYIDVVVDDALSGRLIRGAIADLSQSGLRVIADQYLPVGTKYAFTMKRNPFLRLRGQVRWIRSFTTDTYQLGVAIIEASEDDSNILAKFLELEIGRVTG